MSVEYTNWARTNVPNRCAKVCTQWASNGGSAMVTFDARLLYEVSRHYYELGKTQEQIAESLGISRSQVSRALKRALDDGIVVITLVPPVVDFGSLRDEMIRHFAISDCVIIPGEAVPGRMLTQNLGIAGADYLAENLEAGSTLGVSWGATLRELAVALEMGKPEPRRISVVPLLGGLGQASADLQVNDIASRVANAFGGTNMLLHAPSIVDTPQARNTIMSDSAIKQVALKWDHLDAAVVGVGCFKHPSTLLEDGGFSHEELTGLTDAGIVGDICINFFNLAGDYVSTCVGERFIGVNLEQLRTVKRVIAVAGGVNKASAVVGALRSGVVDVLVTDDITARTALEISGPGK